MLRQGYKLMLNLNLAFDWSSKHQNLEKWIQNIFEIMNGHLERKRFMDCFIDGEKVYINQNAGQFMISEEFDQERFSRSRYLIQVDPFLSNHFMVIRHSVNHKSVRCLQQAASMNILHLLLIL